MSCVVLIVCVKHKMFTVCGGMANSEVSQPERSSSKQQCFSLVTHIQKIWDAWVVGGGKNIYQKNYLTLSNFCMNVL
jgi:hypothetical protein